MRPTYKFRIEEGKREEQENCADRDITGRQCRGFNQSATQEVLNLGETQEAEEEEEFNDSLDS